MGKRQFNFIDLVREAVPLAAPFGVSAREVVDLSYAVYFCAASEELTASTQTLNQALKKQSRSFKRFVGSAIACLVACGATAIVEGRASSEVVLAVDVVNLLLLAPVAYFLAEADQKRKDFLLKAAAVDQLYRVLCQPEQFDKHGGDVAKLPGHEAVYDKALKDLKRGLPYYRQGLSLPYQH